MSVTTRDKIVALTLPLIRKKSYSSFSYDDISRELKITKAAIHYHFEKKEDLGIAICEKAREAFTSCYENTLNEIRSKNGHPWRYIENVMKYLAVDEICLVSSFQSDYENLPPQLKEKVKQLSEMQIEQLELLIKEFAPNGKGETVSVITNLCIKGALQYRRVLGEIFFKKALKSIKEQFYFALDGHNASLLFKKYQGANR